MWLVYEFLLLVGLVLYVPRALWRKRLPHRGWMMRLGRYPASVRARLGKPGAIWIHAVSVGEVLAIQPLIQELAVQQSDAPLVLSTITPTGFDVASKLIGGRGVVIYEPLDIRAAISRALDLIQPRILLLVESEFWPNLICATARRGVPIAVVNGRISARAFRRHRLVRPILAGLFRMIDLYVMQTETDAARVVKMGAPPSRVNVLGSLKWDASLLSRPQPAEIHALAARLGLVDGDALIVAGSTHRGEETAVLDAFQTVRSSAPRVRLVIAPRHLERMGEVEALVRERGMPVQRVSSFTAPTPWDVLIVDTIGQLPLYYALATVAFVGGSLIRHGGQNPLEPASLGKPVIFGPSMENFSEIAQELLAHRAARQLQHAQELSDRLAEWLANPTEAQIAGAHAQALVERLSGVIRRTLEALKPLLTATPAST